MYDFALEKGFQREKSMALSVQGSSCLMMGRFDNALCYYEQSLIHLRNDLQVYLRFIRYIYLYKLILTDEEL